MNPHEKHVLWTSKVLVVPVPTVPESYEAYRVEDHDDLVLSVALACWAGRLQVEESPEDLSE